MILEHSLRVFWPFSANSRVHSWTNGCFAVRVPHFMSDEAVFSGLPAPLAKALTRRGFTALTKVQSAVLADELRGRDLRISSRTGSGKTVALGLAVAAQVAEHTRAPTASLCAHPSVLLVAPTRELAA